MDQRFARDDGLQSLQIAQIFCSAVSFCKHIRGATGTLRASLVVAPLL
jgi:hypothetical protein